MITLALLLVSVTLILISIFGFSSINGTSVKEPTLKELQIPKSRYVRLVVDWCIKNIGNKKVYPKIIVRYNMVKKKQGYFSYADNSAVIYVNTHQSILDLTNTVIHEYVHFIQIPNQKMMKLYNRELQEIGYDNHPMEVEARNIAGKFDKQCMTEVMVWIEKDH